MLSLRSTWDTQLSGARWPCRWGETSTIKIETWTWAPKFEDMETAPRRESQLRGRGHPWSLTHSKNEMMMAMKVMPPQQCQRLRYVRILGLSELKGGGGVLRSKSQKCKENQKSQVIIPPTPIPLYASTTEKTLSSFIQFKSHHLPEPSWTSPNRTY